LFSVGKFFGVLSSSRAILDGGEEVGIGLDLAGQFVCMISTRSFLDSRSVAAHAIFVSKAVCACKLRGARPLANGGQGNSGCSIAKVDRLIRIHLVQNDFPVTLQLGRQSRQMRIAGIGRGIGESRPRYTAGGSLLVPSHSWCGIRCPRECRNQDRTAVCQITPREHKDHPMPGQRLRFAPLRRTCPPDNCRCSRSARSRLVGDADQHGERTFVDHQRTAVAEMRKAIGDQLPAHPTAISGQCV